MKKWLCLCLLAMLVIPANAEHAVFNWKSDLDKDGEEEIFSVEGEDNGTYVNGSLSVIDNGTTTTLIAEAGWLTDHFFINEEIFKAEEGYGFGSSVSKIWYASEDGLQSYSVILTDLTETPYGYAAWITEWDMDEGSTARSVKPYYFYWQGDALIEYAGEQILRNDLVTLAGGQEIIDAIEADGWRIKTIYYRSNDIINITYCDGYNNRNATLYNESSTVQLIGTDFMPCNDLEGSSFGGMYQPISGQCRYMVYPENNVLPKANVN